MSVCCRQVSQKCEEGLYPCVVLQLCCSICPAKKRNGTYRHQLHAAQCFYPSRHLSVHRFCWPSCFMPPLPRPLLQFALLWLLSRVLDAFTLARQQVWFSAFQQVTPAVATYACLHVHGLCRLSGSGLVCCMCAELSLQLCMRVKRGSGVDAKPC
jgi:hypothetical protein